MSSNEVSVAINFGLALLGIIVSLFPLGWARKNNGLYRSGFRLVLAPLSQSAVGCLYYGIVYLLRLMDVIGNAQMQNLARPGAVIFLSLPFTMVVSLHIWKGISGEIENGTDT